MTQISGKLVDDTAVQGEEVTIELPQVDKSKIKAGDEVWIKQEVKERMPGDIYFSYPTIKGIDSVVAHAQEIIKLKERNEFISL